MRVAVRVLHSCAFIGVGAGIIIVLITILSIIIIVALKQGKPSKRARNIDSGKYEGHL